MKPESYQPEIYQIELLGKNYSFESLKSLLGAADFSKAGDRNAGLSAKDEVTREAARALLSSLTLQHLYDHPLTDDRGGIDSVMRVNYEIDQDRFKFIAQMSIGQLKNHLLKSQGDEIKNIGKSMTGVMVAALTKLLDTHELVFIAQKISCPTQARTHLGLPGTLSSRLQPNHPVDDLSGITFLTYAGLSIGSGDALIGINPSIDTVENISALLNHLDKIRRKTEAPTQICVLGHIKTQLVCLEKGVPVEILFQSLAGTERTNLTEFDISVELLDQAYKKMKEKSPFKNFMYFETGQGSEFTYGKHNGMDMTTAEALCYGLARRYNPFMVNNVTGFIGPETHLDNFEMIISNLQDHFMGKLMGLPMGMAPCYTLHSKITLEGQQMATQMLTAAGANYYMDVCLNTDRMLAYFDTSGNDDQTLREIYGKSTTPEYLEWAISKKIFTVESDESGKISRGPNWGNPRIFCESESEYQDLLRATPLLYGFDHAGPRLSNEISRTVKANQAFARDAIYQELNTDELLKIAPFQILETQAESKNAHLNSPELGSRLNEKSVARLVEKSLAQNPGDHPQLQIIVTDGLSSEAIHKNLKDLFTVVNDGLSALCIRTAGPLLLRYGRVKVAEQIAKLLKTELTLLLIGERPGGDAQSSRSLSAYFVYQLLNPLTQKKAAEFSHRPDIRFEYTVLSNIYSGGLPPIEAGSVIVEKCQEILLKQSAGNRLEALSSE